jgi:hypothetical protein
MSVFLFKHYEIINKEEKMSIRKILISSLIEHQALNTLIVNRPYPICLLLSL